jgi:hypothetical protein
VLTLFLLAVRSIFLWRVHDKDQGLLSGDDRTIGDRVMGKLHFDLAG